MVELGLDMTVLPTSHLTAGERLRRGHPEKWGRLVSGFTEAGLGPAVSLQSPRKLQQAPWRGLVSPLSAGSATRPSPRAFAPCLRESAPLTAGVREPVALSQTGTGSL